MIMRFLRDLIAVGFTAILAAGNCAYAQRGGAAPQATVPVGNPEAGKEFWQTLATSSCKNCHGLTGQGGFGPPLAGQGLTLEDFIRATTHPVLMPEFPQYSTQQLADFAAYFATLPKVTERGPWQYPLPPDGDTGLLVAFAIGCPQCHGPVLETPRYNAGAVNGDFEWFKTHVYNHTSVVRDHWKRLALRSPPPYVRMGNYTRERLRESVLEEIWTWMTKEGLLTPVTAGLSRPEQTSEGARYTLTVLNQSLPNAGPAAEDVTISVTLPAEADVVKASGEGYAGVERDAASHTAAAVWHVPRIVPTVLLTYGLTLSKAGADDDVHASIAWTRKGGKEAETLDVRVGQRPRNFP
jgi:mono/diheme cytochrome c family protein